MSQFNTQTYDVERSSGQCAFTDSVLEPGDIYYATLVDLTDEQMAQLSAEDRQKNALGLKRLDVSESSWDQGARPENMFGYWKTTLPEPNKKRKMFVDDALLLNLLRRLADAEQPERIAFRYVLALILMRKKLIRYDGGERRAAEVDGEAVEQSWWKFTPKLDVTKGHFGKWNEEERIEVVDPQLDAGQIEQVTTQLGEILEADL